eukprot:398-Pelagococcus_subviridis.AAC.5
MVKHAIVGVAIAWMVYKNVRRLTSGEDDDDGLDARVFNSACSVQCGRRRRIESNRIESNRAEVPSRLP